MALTKGGYVYYDTPIGILCLESFFPKPKGHIRNPRTFAFPTLIRVIQGVDIPRMLFNPTPDLITPFIEAAKALEREGVKAITGSCGFMALFQERLSAELHIPVFMSSLVQIPLIRLLHGKDVRLGVLTASKKALTAEHFRQCNADINAVYIEGMEGNPEFWETVIEGKRHDVDMEKFEEEIVRAAETMVKQHKLDALLLECTDLSAFAKAIQARVNIPIYDITSMVEYVQYVVCRS